MGKQGIEGKVGLALDVNSEGGVIDVHLSASSGYAHLDRAALNLAKQWLFRPPVRRKTAIRTDVY